MFITRFFTIYAFLFLLKIFEQIWKVFWGRFLFAGDGAASLSGYADDIIFQGSILVSSVCEQLSSELKASLTIASKRESQSWGNWYFKNVVESCKSAGLSKFFFRFGIAILPKISCSAGSFVCSYRILIPMCFSGHRRFRRETITWLVLESFFHKQSTFFSSSILCSFPDQYSSYFHGTKISIITSVMATVSRDPLFPRTVQSKLI